MNDDYGSIKLQLERALKEQERLDKLVAQHVKEVEKLRGLLRVSNSHTWYYKAQLEVALAQERLRKALDDHSSSIKEMREAAEATGIPTADLVRQQELWHPKVTTEPPGEAAP